MKEVKLEVSLDPHKQVIRTYGDGSSTITFSTDATQLAKVLTVLAQFNESLIEITLKRLSKDTINGSRYKETKALR